MDKDGRDQQQQIARYLRDDMSEAERLAFEQQLAQDTTLAASVSAQQDAYALIKKRGQLHLKDRLKTIESGLQPASRPRPRLRLSWIAGVAAASLLLLAFWWLWQPASAMSSDQLYATYYETYRPPANLRGGGNSILLRSQAAELYQKGAYKEAVPYWERLLNTEGGGSLQDRFYLALSHLATQPPLPQKAIPFLKEVANADNDFQQQARWYLALAHLKAGETAKAKTLLKTIETTNAYQAEKAGQLLKKMNF